MEKIKLEFKTPKQTKESTTIEMRDRICLHLRTFLIEQKLIDSKSNTMTDEFLDGCYYEFECKEEA